MIYIEKINYPIDEKKIAGFKKIIEKETCPVCFSSYSTISIREYRKNPPIYEILTSCRVCGYHSYNVVILSDDIPKKKVLTIKRHEDMDIRIVKSNTATIRIKKLGVDIEPAAASQGEIFTVHSLLRKIEGIIRAFTTEENKQSAERLLKKIKIISEDTVFSEFEISLEDPFGDSTFLGGNIEEVPFTVDELRDLKIDTVEQMGKTKEKMKKRIKDHIKDLAAG